MYIRHSFALLLLGLNLLFLSWASRDLCAQNSLPGISEVRFSGNEGISAERLNRVLRRLRKGGRYSESSVSAELQRVKDLYLSEGFLHVEIGPPDVRIRAIGEVKTAAITIPVVEGAQYRAGAISIENVHALSPKTLMQMCPLKKGELYNPIEVSRWREMIEATYREMGHIRIFCKAQEEVNEGDKTVDFTLQCDEGKPYTIGKITVVGDESIDVLKFKRQLLFSEGGLFVPDMLATSIQYLNRMNVYKPISYSDVQIDIREEEAKVDLTFRLFLADP